MDSTNSESRFSLFGEDSSTRRNDGGNRTTVTIGGPGGFTINSRSDASLLFFSSFVAAVSGGRNYDWSNWGNGSSICVVNGNGNTTNVSSSWKNGSIVCSVSGDGTDTNVKAGSDTIPPRR